MKIPVPGHVTVIGNTVNWVLNSVLMKWDLKMPIPDPNSGRNDPLDDSIDRLETFIDETELQKQPGSVPVLNESIDHDDPAVAETIPILDDPVFDSRVDIREHGPDELRNLEERLTGLIDRLEQRLTGVMEELVNSAKREMIDSVLEEIRTQIRGYRKPPGHEDNSARVFEDDPDTSALDGPPQQK